MRKIQEFFWKKTLDIENFPGIFFSVAWKMLAEWLCLVKSSKPQPQIEDENDE